LFSLQTSKDLLWSDRVNKHITLALNKCGLVVDRTSQILLGVGGCWLTLAFTVTVIMHDCV